MTQYEQENDLGRGGGEVDDETMDEAWRTARERRGTGNLGERPDESDADEPQPWAKLSSGDKGD
jgi:hypothetical protein